MDIVIISGLSGSGKTIALQALEDLGYYCIDNLPVVLLPGFAEALESRRGGSTSRVAVGIDSRNREFLQSLPETLRELEELGLDYRIVFLESDEAVLIQRFSETRRKHPLTDAAVSLMEGIRMERTLLAPLADAATHRIDTTHTTPHELRSKMREFAGVEPGLGPVLQFESFGYKHGTPLDADFVFDVRCLPNPHWEATLREQTGLDGPVIEFLEGHDTVTEMIDSIDQFISRWLPRFTAEQRSYITVAVGCTGVLHRSVFVAERLAERFRSRDCNVQSRHREIGPLRDSRNRQPAGGA